MKLKLVRGHTWTYVAYNDIAYCLFIGHHADKVEERDVSVSTVLKLYKLMPCEDTLEILKKVLTIGK